MRKRKKENLYRKTRAYQVFELILLSENFIGVCGIKLKKRSTVLAVHPERKAKKSNRKLTGWIGPESQ